MPRCFEKVSKTFLISLFLAGACFNANDFDFTDNDGDGFAVEFGDCDDNEPLANPGLDEVCEPEFIDNDCDGDVNEGFEGDLNCNNIDDGDEDIDQDGFSINQGDCEDLNDFINPNAVEILDGVDNNCDNQIDVLVPCDGGLSGQNPADFAQAIGICQGELVSATFGGANVSNARAIINDFGNNNVGNTLTRPSEGAQMIHLATGAANEAAHDRGTPFDGAFAGGDDVNDCLDFNHPDPQGQAPANGCGEADPARVCDLISFSVTLEVPPTATALSFDFEFFSSEYPTFRCSQFDDTFVAFLQSNAFTGNVSFDNLGNVVSVNNGFFDICFDDTNNANGGPPNDCSNAFDPNQVLAGTGYVANNAGNANALSDGAGATTRLRTIAPVEPGEQLTLTFFLFDEGDDILDSSVLIDNFVWSADIVDNPNTEIP